MIGSTATFMVLSRFNPFEDGRTPIHFELLLMWILNRGTFSKVVSHAIEDQVWNGVGGNWIYAFKCINTLQHVAWLIEYLR